MAFDEAKFERVDFTFRTKEIPVPELSDFFEPGEDAVFVVRNLTAEEFAITRESADRAKMLEEVFDGITANEPKEKAQAIKTSLDGARLYFTETFQGNCCQAGQKFSNNCLFNHQ